MNKQCKKCFKVHGKVPQIARPDIQEGVLVGYCWECDGFDEKGEPCGSTLYFYKFEIEVIKAMLAEGII
jgi:hypothetical protein